MVWCGEWRYGDGVDDDNVIIVAVLVVVWCGCAVVWLCCGVAVVWLCCAVLWCGYGVMW